MSFGAFSLFSFFQQPNTGIIPTSLNSSILNAGNGASGTIADFNWYYPYGGTIILDALLNSHSRFGFYIWADSYGAVVEGLHYTTVSTAFSGNFGANSDSVFFGDKFYGTIYPQLKDNIINYTSFSGLQTGVHYDSISEYNLFSGKLTGESFDIIFCLVGFSGDISSNADPMYFNTQFSGNINHYDIESISFNNEVSGRFWPLNQDSGQIVFSFLGYSIGTGLYVIPFSGNDSGNLSFSLVGYSVGP